MAERFFEDNRISFSRNDLPPEGDAHNKALHLTVKCEGYYVKRIMLDGGSGVDICPLSTLKMMEIGIERIKPNNVCVRAFDGVKRDTIRDISLILTIGPVDFEVTFQVLDMDTPYNFLLGRPWIHAAGAVPSTLHQMVKFEHENQEIVVHGEDEQSIYKDPSVPYLEARDGSKHIIYQAFEIVLADQCKEGTPCPQPCLSSASIMVTSKMIKHGSNNADLNNMTCLRTSCLDPKTLSNPKKINQELEYDEDEAFREINQEFKQFENKSKPNLNETKPVNLASSEEIKETIISIHVEEKTRDALIWLLFEFKDMFAWSYDDMPGLSVDLVVHKLPTYPAGVIRVVRYSTWLANIVPVPKKDGKIRVCVDYRDLNKASPKDNFPLPNIHILIDSCAKHEIQCFVDCYARYHQVLMDEEDAEKTAFTTPWCSYCYRVMPFSLKDAGATYMRAMTAIFHDMMHQEIEVYVDDAIIKSRMQEDHMKDLRKFFERLRKYDLKLNPAKCAFRVPSGKLLGFIVSRRGIELDPTKIKSI
ncbi:uncharacterized protein [Nicotiana tomentosiformis]|uniref:uncharacterized protein n=1 Tax=Nicotiana tomentosiformis TaxID=4098 RepID=UPI00388CB029